MSAIGLEDFLRIFTSSFAYICLHFSSWSVSMATDCGFLPIFEFYCFQGSIQLRIVRMAPVLDQLSNALLAESGAKNLIKKTTTHKQVNNG